jgi:succinate dehydrogenase/fumarate reductase flavoprotein subunit
MLKQVIVIGGGLSGLSAAHTALEHGAKVLLLDKNPFCGGNSTKATSGLNAALTKTQIRKGIEDSAEIFEKDTARSANLGKSEESYPLAKVKYFYIFRSSPKSLIPAWSGWSTNSILI